MCALLQIGVSVTDSYLSKKHLLTFLFYFHDSINQLLQKNKFLHLLILSISLRYKPSDFQRNMVEQLSFKYSEATFFKANK